MIRAVVAAPLKCLLLQQGLLKRIGRAFASVLGRLVVGLQPVATCIAGCVGQGCLLCLKLLNLLPVVGKGLTFVIGAIISLDIRTAGIKVAQVAQCPECQGWTSLTAIQQVGVCYTCEVKNIRQAEAVRQKASEQARKARQAKAKEDPGTRPRLYPR